MPGYIASMTNFDFDLVVIGSGPGGYVAAARASALGLKTAIVEKDKALGGTCLHRGCIPTKALLHAADTYHEMKDASKIGISAEGVSIDWAKVQKYKDRIIQTNASGVTHLMKGRKVEVFSGFGSLKDSHTIGVESDGASKTISSKFILLAVGSTPRDLPFAKFDGARVLSSDDILELKSIPGSLTIIGGGVIGIEFASLYARIGTEVTVLEALPRVLAPADEDVSKELATQLKGTGVKIQTNVNVKSVKANKSTVTTSYQTESGESMDVKSELLLLSIGRSALTSGIGLENTQAQLDERQFIQVNAMMQTDEPNIYAIGDCVNTPWLAHIASSEAITAVEHMCGKNPGEINYTHTPSCVYSEPPVAWSGLTEQEAKNQGHDVKIGKFDFIRNGKAAILGKKRGFVKFVTDKKHGEILGVHIIGPEATDLLAEPAYAMQNEMTIDTIAKTVHAHPTLYEAIYEAAAVATDQAVHG